MIFYLSLILLFFWLWVTLDYVIGISFKTPQLKKLINRKLDTFPKISIIFSAKDEAQSVGSALDSMLKQHYTNFEVIAVNDRSSDGTLSIIKKYSQDSRLKILDINHLPDGWLGKNHALYQASKQATGEWLLFTDADVEFHPSVLTLSMRAVLIDQLDHLVVIPKMITTKLIEKIFVRFFVLMFNRRFRPWEALSPKSKSFIGIGAFNFIRKSVYEAIGTHKRLALSVVDDMDLGKMVKLKCFRQRAYVGTDFLTVPWVSGWNGVVRSIDKNAFAAMGFNFGLLAVVVLGGMLVDILPFVMIFLAQGIPFWLCLGVIFCIFCCYFFSRKYDSGFYSTFIFHPVASILFLMIICRSAWLVIRQGGVVWRNTFYPIKMLQKGIQ